MATGAHDTLVELVRTTLAAAGDPHRATQQQRSMKSTLPYHGLAMADVRRVTRRAAAQRPPLGRSAAPR